MHVKPAARRTNIDVAKQARSAANRNGLYYFLGRAAVALTPNATGRLPCKIEFYEMSEPRIFGPKFLLLAY